MAILEVAIGAVVAVTFLRELRQTLRAPGTWPFISLARGHRLVRPAAGALLVFEAFHQPHVKPGYLRPPFLSGMVTIGIGLFHGRLRASNRRRRYLKLDANGVECRWSRFRGFSFS